LQAGLRSVEVFFRREASDKCAITSCHATSHRAMSHRAEYYLPCWPPPRLPPAEAAQCCGVTFPSSPTVPVRVPATCHDHTTAARLCQKGHTHPHQPSHSTHTHTHKHEQISPPCRPNLMPARRRTRCQRVTLPTRQLQVFRSFAGRRLYWLLRGRYLL
jgi:hypothetical protein